MVSEGSMGEIVRPMTRHWMTWAIISTFSAMSAAARRRLAFDLRMAPFGTGGISEHGEADVRRVFTSWVPQPLFIDSGFVGGAMGVVRVDDQQYSAVLFERAVHDLLILSPAEPVTGPETLIGQAGGLSSWTTSTEPWGNQEEER